MKTYLTITAALLATTFAFAGCKNPTSEINADPFAQVSKPSNTKIQVALLLDTSNSMDGLIEQAKSRLWNIVNT